MWHTGSQSVSTAFCQRIHPDIFWLLFRSTMRDRLPDLALTGTARSHRVRLTTDSSVMLVNPTGTMMSPCKLETSRFVSVNEFYARIRSREGIQNAGGEALSHPVFPH